MDLYIRRATGTYLYNTIYSFMFKAMPTWTGAVFHFIKHVHDSYIVLKARVSNLVNAADWQHDRIDTDAHPEYLSPAYWETANFTLFVWCPFDVTLGGLEGGNGKITFQDFYDGEHSEDGFLWSFYSRADTKLTRKNDPTSKYFKGLERLTHIALQSILRLH